jgi:hypothetical protein
MADTGNWLTVEERDDYVVISAQLNPRDLVDTDLPAVAKEITATVQELPEARPVVFAGNWPLWAIARAARLAHPRASWIGVQESDGTVIVVAPGQGTDGTIPQGVYKGTYSGGGACALAFGQTPARGVYRLDIALPTPGRPVDGHTTVNLNSVQMAIDTLKAPSDLTGALITGHAWRVVVAMLANAPALRSARWCAVDEPRRDYAVMSWGSHTGGKEKPGALIPREELLKPMVVRSLSLFERLRRRWSRMPITARVAIIVPIIVAIIGLCGAIYAATFPVIIDQLWPTPTVVVATPTPTLTETATPTSVPTATSIPTATETVAPTPLPVPTATP